MTRALSLAHLTFLELTPPALIHVAAQAGFTSVGLRLIAVTDTTPGYPLADDPAMMRDTLQAIKDTGVTVNDIEFLRLTPEFDPKVLHWFLEAGAELGAKNIVTAPYDPDLHRLTDHLAAFAEQAAAFGLNPVLEFFPWTNVPDLQSALRIVETTGNAAIGVLMDTLHFNRSGSSLSDLAAADPARFSFVHVCDAPVQPSYSTEELLFTARTARLMPGQGDIPIADILAQLPDDTPVALEIPLENRRGLPCDAVAKDMLAQTIAYLGRARLRSA
jgi:sugar phosphate isomerase/epimerase